METEAEVSRVRRLVALQQEEDRARRLEPGQERREAQEKVLGDRQELEWQAREDRVASTRGHRETALDGYIKVAGVDIYISVSVYSVMFMYCTGMEQTGQRQDRGQAVAAVG